MLSNRLKTIRKQRGYTQTGLAHKVNTTKGTISNYENGYSTPSNEMLVVLANALDVTTDYLLGRSDNPNYTDEQDFTDGIEDYDSIQEINRLLKEYGIDQSGFFDIEKWKAMGPEEIKQLESYFKFITEEAKKKN